MNKINWYPGHMKKTKDLIRESLGMTDLILEVVDARIPESSRSPVIRELTEGKPCLIILNKSDLADGRQNALWAQGLTQGSGHLFGENVGEAPVRAVVANSMSGEGIGRLLAILEEEQDLRRASGTSQKLQRPLRMMIAGVPNVGKSSMINRLTGRKSAKTGDRPGVTRGKQWLTLKNGMQLLDTPGILAPRLKDQTAWQHLAFCGSVKDEIMEMQDLGFELIKTLLASYPAQLEKRYGIDLEAVAEESFAEAGYGRGAEPEGVPQPLAVMEAIARKRGCIFSGGRIDYERCARMVVDEFRAGRIGRITLEPWEEGSAEV